MLQETEVVVARGQTLSLDLPCGGTLPAGDAAPTTPATPSNPVTGGGGAKPTLTFGAVKRTGKRVRATLSASAPLTGVRLTVRRGRKTVGAKNLKTLSGTRKVTVKLARKPRRGRYTVRATAAGATTAKGTFRVR